MYTDDQLDQCIKNHNKKDRIGFIAGPGKKINIQNFAF